MQRCLLVLPFILAPFAASAQEGPSFDCDDAGTRTEIAICADPRLARLEMLMFGAYQGLVDAIGQREARAIADEFLARRQACEGDTACITDRLLISMEAFNQRAGRTTDLAQVEAVLRGVPDASIVGEAAPPVVIEEAPALVAAPESALPPVLPTVTPEPRPAAPEVAQAEPQPAADPGVPLAAQAPWPVQDPPSSEELSAALEDAALASSDGAEAASAATADPTGQASFDSPLSWAFMDLTREQRSALQARLAQAGFLDGEATGSWTNATQAALEEVVEQEGSGSFDLATQTGAALLLDYVGSDAFATSFGIGSAVETEVAAPLAGTDW